MKFGSLHSTEQKSIKVRSFKSGTILGGIDADIPDDALSQSENMWFDGGVLRTRPALCADISNIIKKENSFFNNTLSYKVADDGVYIKGEYKKIALEEYCLDDSIYYCNIFFVGAEGKSAPAGGFIFNRINDECFYQPTNILFYSGAAVNGAGIFALVSTANIYNYSEKSYQVYELSSNLGSWQELNSFYVPVVYINGRGNRYEESKATGYAYTEEPVFLEAQNLLTDRFKAYFTSDGYSSAFRLPVSNLNNEAVVCRVYISTDAYTEWCVQEGQISATVKFYTANITLNVDRKKGIIYFTNSEGDYPVPMISKYHENNICVTAGKTLKNGFESVVSSTCCTAYGSKILFSGGSEKGKIFSIHSDNPLYFPCDSVGTVGGNDGINVLLTYKNGVLAFKQNEIYALTLKNGSAINSSSLLADDDSVFYNVDSFTVKKISGDKGSNNKYACLLCGNEAVWLGSDRRVYSLSTSSFEITELSERVDSFLNSLDDNEIKKAFAVQNGNRFLLLIGKKAVIMDFSKGGIKNSAWYLWSFPMSTLLGAVSFAGKLRIFCIGSDGEVFYTASLSGNEDTDIFMNNGTANLKKQWVSSSLITKRFDFGSMTQKKFIDSIGLSASSFGKIDIFINGKYFDRLNLHEPDIDYTCGTFKSVKLIPHLTPVFYIQLKLSSDKAFSLGELIINYRETV